MAVDLGALKDDLKGEFEAVGKELAASGVLTPDERQKVLDATVGMGVAYAQGEAEKVGNYRAALNAWVGVAELRAATAAEKAALSLANRAIGILTKIALAALT